MPRLKPIASDAALPESLSRLIAGSDAFMGFAANDVRTLALWPELLQALGPVVHTIYGAGAVDSGLKRLIAEATSQASGCRYCTAHTAHGAAQAGVPLEKIAAVWNADDSPLFTKAERAALRVARGAAQTPNAVTDADFAELQAHFDDRAIIEIVAMISLFGFLNRWNSTLATDLEQVPRAFGEKLGVASLADAASHV
jgi:uncharacterized peroxidase-related enzyme